mgnify:CR=1 FL=1
MPNTHEDQFIAKVWEEGARLYRDLPWRGIDDPYAVLVSEVMLQQTQVEWTRTTDLTLIRRAL